MKCNCNTSFVIVLLNLLKTSGLEPLTFSLKEKHSTNRVLFPIKYLN